MRVRNSEGVPVDPVPFLVVALLSGTALVTFATPYLMAFGVNVGRALVVSLTLSVGAAALAYHRFIWTMDPLAREEVPAATRFLRLLYGIVVLVLLVLGLRGLLTLA